jgi:hypothetical protein
VIAFGPLQVACFFIGKKEAVVEVLGELRQWQLESVQRIADGAIAART